MIPIPAPEEALNGCVTGASLPQHSSIISEKAGLGKRNFQKASWNGKEDRTGQVRLDKFQTFPYDNSV